MTQEPDILLVSNGYGEAAIAGYIARAIVAKAPKASVEHLALVGQAASDAWPPRVGPAAELPSGGLVANWNVCNLAGDLRAGLLRLLVRQYAFVRAQRGRSAVVAVGDVFCLAMSLVARRLTVFVATAKSDYVSGHSGLERRFARKAAVTFARDEQTARTLRQGGVGARYAGNVMMDGIAPGRTDLSPDPAAIRLAVLPGSRSDAPAEARAAIERLQAAARRLRPLGKRVQAFVSVAPSLDARSLRVAICAAGVALPDPGPGEGVVARATAGTLEVLLVRGGFGDVLAASQVVLGQAGTANEQAAGCGKPVVAALSPGELPSKMHWYRMRQKRLLGDALAVFPPTPDAFANDLVALLDDPTRLDAMAAAGRQRMGGPGGADAVAEAVLDLVRGLP